MQKCVLRNLLTVCVLYIYDSFVDMLPLWSSYSTVTVPVAHCAVLMVLFLNMAVEARNNNNNCSSIISKDGHGSPK